MISLAFGVGTIVFLLLVQQQIQEKFTNNIKGVKMVIGAKGSPLQLILCNVYHIDLPTGNIPIAEAQKLQQNRRFVKQSIPLSLGDNYQNYRIVGTNHDYPKHYKAKLAEGRLWKDKSTLEATIGAEVAQKLNLKVGSTFSGAHGLDAEGDKHDDKQYRVVGILKPTRSVLDRLILTSLESVWAVHDLPLTAEAAQDSTEGIMQDTREITALLITEYTNPMAAIMLPRIINNMGNLQSASPAWEVNRMFSLIGVGEQVLQAFGFLIIAIALLSIFVALYNALKERRYDMAVMRTLGASQSRLFGQVLLEAFILILLGSSLGILLGHSAVVLIGTWESVSDKIQLSGSVFLIEELWLVLAVFVVGLIAAIIPAWQVYRIDISRTLSE